jgi:hypothetical protein
MIDHREKARKCLAWEKAYNSVREQLVGKGQVQEYERESAIANYNQSSNFNQNANFNRTMPQQNDITLPNSNYSLNSGLRDDMDGTNSPSKRRFRRMETITATTIKLANPNPNQGRQNNLNVEYDYDHRQTAMLPTAGQTFSHRYHDQGQGRGQGQGQGQGQYATNFNNDIARFNYVEDEQYQRTSRNIIANQSNFKPNNQQQTNSNKLSSNSPGIPPGIPSNRLKRPLPRGQFFD